MKCFKHQSILLESLKKIIITYTLQIFCLYLKEVIANKFIEKEFINNG
jgi:hypothetical protein